MEATKPRLPWYRIVLAFSLLGGIVAAVAIYLFGFQGDPAIARAGFAAFLGILGLVAWIAQRLRRG